MRLGSASPVAAVASTAILVSGASTGLVVIGQTVTDAVASKRSSWMMTTGLGLPVYEPRAAAMYMSPRLTRRSPPRRPSRQRSHRRMPGRRLHAHWPRWPRTGDAPLRRTPRLGHRAPRSGWAEVPVRAACADARVPAHVYLPQAKVTCNARVLSTEHHLRENGLVFRDPPRRQRLDL